MIALGEIAERSRKQIAFTKEELEDMGHGIAQELLESEGKQRLDIGELVEYMVHAVCMAVAHKVVRAVDDVLKEYEKEEG